MIVKSVTVNICMIFNFVDLKTNFHIQLPFVEVSISINQVFMIPLYLFGHVVLLSDAGEGSPGYSKPLAVKLNSGGI